ncbi:MAG TPA: methyltransferase domain-containing protein, partial [Myxococcota bacterium]
EDIAKKGGADLVLLARVLHHAARPQDALAAAARLCKRGGHVVIVDYLPHHDEALREQGDVWLGFDPLRLRSLVEEAGLTVVAGHPLPHGATAQDSQDSPEPPLQIAVGKKEGPHGHAH